MLEKNESISYAGFKCADTERSLPGFALSQGLDVRLHAHDSESSRLLKRHIALASALYSSK